MELIDILIIGIVLIKIVSYYNPKLDIVYNNEKLYVVLLWYNKYVDNEIKRTYKIIIKI